VGIEAASTTPFRRPVREDPEVIRMSQWAEIRHMFLVDQVPKREIARRLSLDVKTVRRALEGSRPPSKSRPRRGRRLDPHRVRVEGWLLEDRRARRITDDGR
jgi:hypothetical protein